MSQVPFGELFRVFGRIGLMSFGGPAAQIALMHRELVETRDWLSERQYLSALSFCMLLPGPEAMQLATYAGWRLRGVSGGLLAGLLFVLPGAALIAVLAALYSRFGELGFVEAMFLGIKAAVVVVVLQALLKVSRKALGQRLAWLIALMAFLGLFVFALPFPLIIASAGLIGALFLAQGEGDSPDLPHHGATGRTIALWLGIWLVPLAALWLLDPTGILTQIGIFFAKLAVVTFGGAYAVLAYMAQEVVTGFGWLEPGEMMDALGLAETTPGPLILVTEFVGFLAGEGAGGIWLGLAAALVTLWATFAPCFLWIFAGAPYVEWISGQPRLRGALSGITAAVVGVIANLSLWFALHVVFARVDRLESVLPGLWLPELSSLDSEALLLSLLAGWLLLARKLDLLLVLAIMAGAGAVWQLALMPLFG